MRWNYRSTQTKREYWLSMVGLAVKSFESGRNYRVSNTNFCHWCSLHVRKRKITKHSNSVTRQRQPLISKPQYFRDFGRERNCSDSNLASVDNHEWPPYCKEAKWHGTQTTGGAGTIFEGKWNCMMLKLAFEPEHALEVEETFGCCTFTYFTIWAAFRTRIASSWIRLHAALATNKGAKINAPQWKSVNTAENRRFEGQYGTCSINSQHCAPANADENITSLICKRIVCLSIKVFWDINNPPNLIWKWNRGVLK